VIDATPPFYYYPDYGRWDRVLRQLIYRVAVGRLRNLRKVRVSNRLTQRGSSPAYLATRHLTVIMKMLEKASMLGQPHDPAAMREWVDRHIDRSPYDHENYFFENDAVEQEEGEEGGEGEQTQVVTTPKTVVPADVEGTSSGGEDSELEYLRDPALRHCGVWLFDEPC
jgi:hypothetical protein